jgi:hypothetical protein
LAEASGSDLPRRIDALEKLGTVPMDPKYQDAVASLLVTTLTDRNPVIRANAVAALGIWARPADFRAVAVLLDDGMAFVRDNVLKSLPRPGTRSSSPRSSRCSADPAWTPAGWIG